MYAVARISEHMRWRGSCSSVGMVRSITRSVVLALSLSLSAVAAGGCASEEDVSSSSFSKQQLELLGPKFVYGVMGLGDAPSATDSVLVRQNYAAAGHMIAIIEMRQPGSITALSADMQSGDAARVLKGMTWLNAILDDIAVSDELSTRLSADPLFAEIRTQGGGSGGAGSGGGTASGGGTGGTKEIPNLGADKDGKYGDANTGMAGAAKDLKDLGAPTPQGFAARSETLKQIDEGKLTPPPDSRLGAYDATKGYPPGTVGSAVHNAIGTIYKTLDNYGQENIGRVFNSPEARALYNEPVTSDAGRRMAEIEHRYWDNVRREDPRSAGGQLGSAFSPSVRDGLQRHWFGRK
jgi:hypothetical protein